MVCRSLKDSASSVSYKLFGVTASKLPLSANRYPVQPARVSGPLRRRQLKLPRTTTQEGKT